jgi:hypothetical protein
VGIESKGDRTIEKGREPRGGGNHENEVVGVGEEG